MKLSIMVWLLQALAYTRKGHHMKHPVVPAELLFPEEGLLARALTFPEPPSQRELFLFGNDEVLDALEGEVAEPPGAAGVGDVGGEAFSDDGGEVAAAAAEEPAAEPPGERAAASGHDDSDSSSSSNSSSSSAKAKSSTKSAGPSAVSSGSD